MSTIFLAWLLLALSILFEVAGTLSLKYSDGFNNSVSTSSAIFCFMISIWLMSISLKQIEMGSSYAIWAASSTAIVAVFGITFHNEAISQFKISGIVLIIIGVVLISLNSKQSQFQRYISRLQYSKIPASEYVKVAKETHYPPLLISSHIFPENVSVLY